jgi:3'-phosphoadenosine 5'-phosphosulfate (PAPS) 3'-phosphatase
MKKTQGLRRLGAAALDLAYVAAGRFDGYWEFNLKPWDAAAGKLLVEEAGGRVTNFRGRPYTLTDTSQTLASNGTVAWRDASSPFGVTAEKVKYPHGLSPNRPSTVARLPGVAADGP